MFIGVKQFQRYSALVPLMNDYNVQYTEDKRKAKIGDLLAKTFSDY